MSPIRSLAFVVNAQKPGAQELAEELMETAREARVSVKQTDTFPVPGSFLTETDAACVIGGDGTLLGVAASAAEAGVPLIGVNRGSLGFLTTFTSEEAREHLSSLLAGDYTLAERVMLECNSETEQHDLALNDIVIKDERPSRLTRLSVEADGEFVTTYSCDGLILASPTGSTAYNLSAGGPLIHPSAEVLALTPICPHTLSNRSIIFREDVDLVIAPEDPDSCVTIAIDGQRNLRTCQGGKIAIRISPHRLQLIHRASFDHFGILRTKLKWSGGVTDGG